MSGLNLHITESEQRIALKAGFSAQRSHRKLESLLQSVQHAGESEKRQVVQFLSINRAQDKALPASFEAAYSEAQKSEKPILYIDTSEDMGVIAAILDSGDAQSKDLEMLKIYNVDGTSLSLLSCPRRIDDQGVDHEILTPMIEDLKSRFHMIIIDGNSPLHCPENVEFGIVSDGTVLVLQAELTRVPVIREAVALLEKFNVTIIGSVLNNRKLYIPQFVYKILFRS